MILFTLITCESQKPYFQYGPILIIKIKINKKIHKFCQLFQIKIRSILYHSYKDVITH